jgi:hypothetical protein
LVFAVRGTDHHDHHFLGRRPLRNPTESSALDRLDVCTVLIKGQRLCGQPAMRGISFPICEGHAVAAYRAVSKIVGDLSDDARFRETVSMESEPARRMRESREGFDRTQYVYYVRLGQKIKIGYTGNLRNRLNAYGPGRELLALEYGGLELEKQRHQQFREYRATGAGREWFSQAEELLDHIRQLPVLTVVTPGRRHACWVMSSVD